MNVFEKLPAETLNALRFLTRIPLPQSKLGDNEPDFESMAAYFPIAGLVIGVLSAAVLIALDTVGLPSLLCALITIGSLVAVTGALHEDGLADVADGFWGGFSTSRKLAIMRDSTIGTYGCLALIFSVALRVFAVSALLEGVGVWMTALSLVAIVSLSRGAMVYSWTTLPSARARIAETEIQPSKKDSTSLSDRYGVPEREVWRTALPMALPALACLFVVSLTGSIIALIMAGLLIHGFNRLCINNISGRTGDTLGATQQICEMGLLIGLLTSI